MTEVLIRNRVGLKIGDVVGQIVRTRRDGTADVEILGTVTRLVQGDEPLAAVRLGRVELEEA